MNRARWIEKLEEQLEMSVDTCRALSEDKSTVEYRAADIDARRIRSIIRRLKQCPVCLGRRVVYGRFVGEVKYMQLECQECNGTGRAVRRIQQGPSGEEGLEKW